MSQRCVIRYFYFNFIIYTQLLWTNAYIEIYLYIITKLLPFIYKYSIWKMFFKNYKTKSLKIM